MKVRKLPLEAGQPTQHTAQFWRWDSQKYIWLGESASDTDLKLQSLLGSVVLALPVPGRWQKQMERASTPNPHTRESPGHCTFLRWHGLQSGGRLASGMDPRHQSGWDWLNHLSGCSLLATWSPSGKWQTSVFKFAKGSWDRDCVACIMVSVSFIYLFILQRNPHCLVLNPSLSPWRCDFGQITSFLFIIYWIGKIIWHKGLSGGLVVKNPPANAADTGLFPGLGRSSGEGNSNPFQYSCLGNPVDRRAWWATVHGIARVWDDLAPKQQQQQQHATQCRAFMRTKVDNTFKASSTLPGKGYAFNKRWILIIIILPVLQVMVHINCLLFETEFFYK